VYKKALVGTDIEGGKRLVEALDKANLQITAALWWFDPEIERWKLIISSPKLKRADSTTAYGLIQRILLGMQQRPDIRLDEIVIEDPESPLIATLARSVHTGPQDLADIRLSSTAVDSIWVEEAHVYRLT